MFHINTIRQYNEHIGKRTVNPDITLVDLSEHKVEHPQPILYNIYAIYLIENDDVPFRYGMGSYDRASGSVYSVAPGQVFGYGDEFNTESIVHGYGLLFHPDLVAGTELGRTMSDYKFFNYRSNSALIILPEERDIILNCIRNITYEITQARDNQRKRIMVHNVSLILDYLLRAYERQYQGSSHHSGDQRIDNQIVTRLEEILSEYITSGQGRKSGLPSVAYCAEQFSLTPNYFGDLIKRYTGITAQEYIQIRLINAAEERLSDQRLTISQISAELGFAYPTHFTRLFKKRLGITPNEYRRRK